ncbi:MAG TPA: hypothetical protein VG013_09405 [Gemmataceae bacterium]|jgi:hypothetical protein|nr:hypothetical protein [Gemmataceae bacterium]
MRTFSRLPHLAKALPAANRTKAETPVHCLGGQFVWPICNGSILTTICRRSAGMGHGSLFGVMRAFERFEGGRILDWTR